MTEIIPVDDNRDEAIFRERLDGASERSLAKRYGLTVKEVGRIMEALAPTIDHAARRRELALDLARIDRLTRVFYKRALEGDVPCASITIKLLERRAAMWGHDSAPLRLDQPMMTVMQPPPAPTSTERIRAAIERVCRERPQPSPPPQPQSGTESQPQTVIEPEILLPEDPAS